MTNKTNKKQQAGSTLWFLCRNDSDSEQMFVFLLQLDLCPPVSDPRFTKFRFL